jgi:hypothetical protein
MVAVRGRTNWRYHFASITKIHSTFDDITGTWKRSNAIQASPRVLAASGVDAITWNGIVILFTFHNVFPPPMLYPSL